MFHGVLAKNERGVVSSREATVLEAIFSVALCKNARPISVEMLALLGTSELGFQISRTRGKPPFTLPSTLNGRCISSLVICNSRVTVKKSPPNDFKKPM